METMSLGFLITIFVTGAILAILVFRFLSKFGFNNPRYDERQKSLNSKGISLAYLATYLMACFYIMTARWIFPTVSAYFVAFSFFIIPATIQVSHNILKGSLFALNIKRSIYHLVFSVLGLIGLLMLIISLYELFSVKENLAFFFSRHGAATTFLMALFTLVESLSYAYRTYLDKKES